MPIDVNEFNLGKIECSLKEKILSFLMNNPDKAFNVKEIIEGTGYSIQVVMQGYGMTPESKFRLTLEKLQEEGSVETRAIKKLSEEEMYYKFVKVDTK